MNDVMPSISVAVVDDDVNLCRSMGRFLHASGLRPTSYLSAEEFLADADRARFDCLILDVQLGGMSGLDLSEHLAASGSTTPVVFITAHDEPERRKRALQSGCSAYLNKSEPGNVVLTAISRAVHSARKRQ